MPEKIIELKSVHLTLHSRAGSVKILRGVDLAIGEGETVGIVGPSGSGKSTLLMIMTGLEKASSGIVNIAGQDFMALGEDGLARARGENIGIVFQSFHLVPTMTALENVALPLEFLGRANARERAAEVLGTVGLGHRLDHFPAQLSGGEQQRVAIARALSPNPKILFADEPTGNLDARNGEQIMDLLFSLHKRHGTTLVLITHDQRLAARCGRVIGIEDGRIARETHGLESVA
ncbi:MULTISPECIES: ABC transporter ATP-binding protein [Rhodomicrobium]|uniref:ABC transporter ATP-binding protein n=1 Tax=Rhodomicrobium sp. R_RK_3 TaxID=2029567 RepID=UPI001481E6B4|nr:MULTISPECIES: ABC transporter ATP-binding protein [Rhodomicrobium]